MSTRTMLLGGTLQSRARAGGIAEHLSSMSRLSPYFTGVEPSYQGIIYIKCFLQEEDNQKYLKHDNNFKGNTALHGQGQGEGEKGVAAH